MAKAAVRSLAASLLLHLAFGSSVQAPSVSRAPLSTSRPTELEFAALDVAPPSAPPLAVRAAGTTEPRPVAERPPPLRGAASEAKPSASLATVLPAPPPATPPSATPPSATPPSATPPSATPPNESASAVSEGVAALASNDPGVAVEASSVALPTSRDGVEPNLVEPNLAATGVSGTAAAGVALATSGAAGRGGSGAAAGASVAPGRSAAGDGDADRGLRAAYLQELRRRVLGHRVYPYLARRARLEGTVCLRVSLNGQGQVARLEATCAAPTPLLEAAFSAVRTAAPFGPLPSSLGGALTVDLPMVFQLEAM